MSDQIFLGSQDVAADRELLRRHEIKQILNLAPSAVPHHFPEEFDYMAVPALDTPEDTALMDSMEEISRFIAKPGAKTLVHCNAGVSRAPAAAVACIMTSEDCTSLREAFARVQAVRPCARPNPGLWTQLQQLEARIRQNK